MRLHDDLVPDMELHAVLIDHVALVDNRRYAERVLYHDFVRERRAVLHVLVGVCNGVHRGSNGSAVSRRGDGTKQCPVT